LALWAYGRVRREPAWALADALAVPILILSALAWLGCAAGACAPGREVQPGALPAWFLVDWPDNFGISALRWPTQVLGAAWSLLLIPLLALARPLPDGGRVLLALAGIALGALALAFTRGDAMPQIAGLRLDAVGSGVVLGLAVLAFAIRGRGGESVKRET
jgi:prolipoprotein diacylglyceryltransferase